MSVLNLLVFLVLTAAACFGSWKAALYWNVRTREARDEDPRDQEIRELGAALSIARKELADATDNLESRGSEAHELTTKLEFSSSSLADIKEKFNATKDHLNREIEQRQELTQELDQTRRELDTYRARVTELEVQAKVASSGSGMIAGFDVAPDEDDMELDALRTANDSLEQEVQRWKQHCAKLTRALKQLQNGSGNSADTPPAQQQG